MVAVASLTLTAMKERIVDGGKKKASFEMQNSCIYQLNLISVKSFSQDFP